MSGNTLATNYLRSLLQTVKFLMKYMATTRAVGGLLAAQRKRTTARTQLKQQRRNTRWENTMTEQTKAQRLAALIEPWGEEEAEAAAELRRLDALNAELVEALVEAGDFIQPFNRADELLGKIDAALAKAKEQT